MCSVFPVFGCVEERNRDRKLLETQVRRFKRAPGDAGRLPLFLLRSLNQSMTGEEAWRLLAVVLAVGGRGRCSLMIGRGWRDALSRCLEVLTVLVRMREGAGGAGTPQQRNMEPLIPPRVRPRLGVSWHFSGGMIVSVSFIPRQPIESCAGARLLSPGRKQSRATFSTSRENRFPPLSGGSADEWSMTTGRWCFSAWPVG